MWEDIKDLKTLHIRCMSSIQFIKILYPAEETNNQKKP